MNSSFCLKCAEIEELLWRMVRGVFHFSFIKVPNWLYRAMLDTVGPAVIRMARVALVFCLWLAVVFSPVTLAIKLDFSAWPCLVCVGWMILAIAGSIWGRAYLKRRMKDSPWDPPSLPATVGATQ
jgi:thiol:disulfide interchange protein